MEQRAITAVVTGRVQGVWFRRSTQREAGRLGVVGWVRNRPDGTVETFAQGTEAQLAAFEAFLWEGPPAAEVTGVSVADAVPVPDPRGFAVRP